MLSSLRQCTMTLTRIHTSKVKVTPHIKRSEYTCLCIDLTYTTHNLKKYPSITCSYIQEYLGYLSNNLYFLFSHSLPVVVYNFGKVQRTSQVERKTKCSKKNNGGGYSRPLDCLVHFHTEYFFAQYLFRHISFEDI